MWWSKENKEEETKTEEESSGDQAQVTTAATTSEPLPPSNTTSTSSTSTIVSAEKLLVSSDPSRVLFVVRAAIQGHVIELNERLVRRGTAEITDPVVIQTLLDKASTHGFVAVIRPKIEKSEIALKDLLTLEDYERMRMELDRKMDE